MVSSEFLVSEDSWQQQCHHQWQRDAISEPRYFRLGLLERRNRGYVLCQFSIDEVYAHLAYS